MNCISLLWPKALKLQSLLYKHYHHVHYDCFHYAWKWLLRLFNSRRTSVMWVSKSISEKQGMYFWCYWAHLSILKPVLDNLLETYGKSLISSLFCVHLQKAENRWNFLKFQKLVQKLITNHLNHLIWHGCNVMIRNDFHA